MRRSSSPASWRRAPVTGRADPLGRYLSVRDGARPPRRVEMGVSLTERSRRARDMLSKCRMCARRCDADRAGGAPGACGVPAESRYDTEFLHLGEEPELVPSHTIFFTGCTLRCRYCQNFEIAFDPTVGRLVVPGELAELIDRRHREGSANVNFVGGDPAPHLAAILETLALVREDVAVVFNSNMYLSDEALDLLDGVVDLYLADLRYGDDRCASELSRAPAYTDVVHRALLAGARQADVIVRHLVLPGHLDCCTKPALRWLAERLPDVCLNLMFQYRPCYRAEGESLGRLLTAEEREEAREEARELGLL